LINFAKSRALTLKNTDVFEHAKGLQYGENLHFISPYSSYDCTPIVKVWYNEIKHYNYNNPSNSKGMVGHFTRVVWKSSLRVGCAQAYSKNSKNYILFALMIRLEIMQRWTKKMCSNLQINY
jgi:hypothetical protein